MGAGEVTRKLHMNLSSTKDCEDSSFGEEEEDETSSDQDGLASQTLQSSTSVQVLSVVKKRQKRRGNMHPSTAEDSATPHVPSPANQELKKCSRQRRLVYHFKLTPV